MGSIARITRRRLAAVPLALLLTMLVAAPGRAGGTPGEDPAEYGTSAACMYRSADVPGIGATYRLRRIVVQPPSTLYARHPGQIVGWRFLVQRSEVVDQPFERIFAGRIHTSPATLAQPGAFTTKRAGISWADPVENVPIYGHFFRAVAKFYWYAGDGTLRRVERHVLSPYSMYVNGVNTGWLIYGGCYEVWPDLAL